MNILAIETSMGCASVALRKESGSLIAKSLRRDETAAEKLIPLIADVMREGDLPFCKVNLIAVCVGPGGFSGIRTGVAAARGIGLAAKIPVAGATSFRIMAHLARSTPGAGLPDGVTLIAAAGMNAFYCQHVRHDEPDGEILYFEAAGAVGFVKSRGAPVAGPGAKALFGLDECGLTLASMDIQPSARALAAIATALDPAVDYPAPFYIRPADAKPQTGHIIPRQQHAAG